MTLLDRVRACHAHDPTRYRPLHIDGRRAGLVRHDHAERLARFDDVFVVSDRSVGLAPGLVGPEARAAAVDDVVAALRRDGVVPDLPSERYDLAPRFGAPPWLTVERSALPLLGGRAHGVHMTGIVRRNGEELVWVARRSRRKTTYPGQLDNMVAGGQPSGLSVRDNLVKECAEEAGIPAALARRARPVGVVGYRLDIARGLRDDVLFLFELELPADFVPRPVDGEVEAFELWTVERLRRTVAETHDFKFNCNLVIVDYLVRHGHLGPDDPEYLDLVTTLRGPMEA